MLLLLHVTADVVILSYKIRASHLTHFSNESCKKAYPCDLKVKQPKQIETSRNNE